MVGTAERTTIWHDAPVIGELVRVENVGDDYRSTSSGIYLGVFLDEEDRVPYHYFVKGEINGHPQSCFGFPAALGDELTDERTPTQAIREALAADDRLRFEIVLGATKDRAQAETAEAALLAAATLVDDACSGLQGELRMLRESLYITENGTYTGILTAFARVGRRVL